MPPLAVRHLHSMPDRCGCLGTKTEWGKVKKCVAAMLSQEQSKMRKCSRLFSSSSSSRFRKACFSSPSPSGSRFGSPSSSSSFSLWQAQRTRRGSSGVSYMGEKEGEAGNRKKGIGERGGREGGIETKTENGRGGGEGGGIWLEKEGGGEEGTKRE